MNDTAETALHPLAIVLLIASCIWIAGTDRRKIGLPLLILACFVSPAQRLVLGGASLYALRILIFIGITRVVSTGEMQEIRINSVDKFVILWSLLGLFVYSTQSDPLQGLIFKLGQTVDNAGSYFLFRSILRGVDDLLFYVRALAIIVVPVSIAFIFEYLTRYNLFSMFGGVPAITAMREGRLRCQGAFAHAILAGTFWAAILPTLFNLFFRSLRDRIIAVFGVTASIVIIITCASSTPVLGVMVAVAGLLLYPFRQYMRWFRWTAVLGLLALSLIMNAPIWSLLARINLVSGSTGYYRYKLVDAAISHVGEWWLLGLRSNESWGREWGHYLTDITNQYILEGLRGGMLGLVSFVGVLTAAFYRVGKLWRSQSNAKNRFLMWSLGCALAVHAICFQAVSYFGQIVMVYNLHLAFIASLPISEKRLPSTNRKGVRTPQLEHFAKVDYGQT